MCGRALGGKVFPHPDGHAEIGYYPIRPTSAGLAVVNPWPEQVYQWHREGFDLPSGAELLASGDMFAVQAFRYGRSYALQFHPDVTSLMMHKWTTLGHLRLELPGAKPYAAHFADRAVYDYSAPPGSAIFSIARSDIKKSSPAVGFDLNKRNDISGAGNTLHDGGEDLLAGRKLLGEIGDGARVNLRRVPLQQYLEIRRTFAPRLAALPTIAFEIIGGRSQRVRARCE